MGDLSILTTLRDDLLVKIREIEASCEGIENENNKLSTKFFSSQK